MNRTIDRLKLIFLALFGFGTVVVFVYHAFWVWPGQRCETSGKWWDGSTRTCAQPILISDITGRTIGDKREEVAYREALAKEAAAAKAASTPKAAAAPPASTSN
jgi:hypothetical protein